MEIEEKTTNAGEKKQTREKKPQSIENRKTGEKKAEGVAEKNKGKIRPKQNHPGKPRTVRSVLERVIHQEKIKNSVGWSATAARGGLLQHVLKMR